MTETSTASAAGSGRRRRDDVLLDVRNLRTYFHVMDGTVPAVDGVVFSARARARRSGIVGESGSRQERDRADDHAAARHPAGRDRRAARSGSTAARSCRCPIEEMRKIRGNDIAMIFQEPLTSLNPVFTVGDQIAEQVELHKKVSKQGGLGPGDRVAPAGRHPEPGAAGQAVPARDVGRHAPARDDRDGPVVRAEAAHRRRADDRARRHDPGPDPGAAQGDPGADRRRR